MNKRTLSVFISSLLIPLFASPMVLAEELESVTVYADFRPVTLEDSTVSVSVISDADSQQRGAQHIEDVLNMAPNVNMSSGASRSRYFQIRGIGERAQFATPINPSVGLFVDGIDFSRSGAAATMFDVNQIEVVRGPQGTRYGANALAGIINLKTTEPSDETKVHIESTLADYGTKSLGAAAGGALIKDKLLGRASVHGYQSDGYIRNDYLNRDETNGRDEVTARAHLKWLAGEGLTVDMRYLYLDIDNGYDAFTMDNTRNTLSDEPGKDTQQTNALSVETSWDINSAVTLEASGSHSDSDLEYSYDEDWSFVGQFAPALWPYSSFDQYLRNRKNTTVEARLLSTDAGRLFNDRSDWVAGVYHSAKAEDLQRSYTFLTNDFFSQYETESLAIYAQLDTDVSDRLVLITGLRAEQWDAEYTDSDNNKISVDELLHGGKLGIEYELNSNHLSHASISRGYKAGGVNADGTLPQYLLDFDTEYLWNFEVGMNSSWMADSLSTRLSIFYARRKDQQVNSSIVTLNPGGSSTFTDYIGNAAKGKNYGLEAELDWELSTNWRLRSALGLLKAVFDEYDDPQSLANGLDLAGRDQAQAPSYQYAVGVEYLINPNITAGVNVEGKDGFFFSDRHNSRAASYDLLNANVAYTNSNWTATLWGRNLLDKDYDVRGFGSFGNNPGNGYAVETYTQKGEPRVVGITVSYDY